MLPIEEPELALEEVIVEEAPVDSIKKAWLDSIAAEIFEKFSERESD